MRIAYDFRVSPADPNCLFEVFEDEETKFSRWESETGEKIAKKARKAKNFIPTRGNSKDIKNNFKKGVKRTILNNL